MNEINQIELTPEQRRWFIARMCNHLLDMCAIPIVNRSTGRLQYSDMDRRAAALKVAREMFENGGMHSG